MEILVILLIGGATFGLCFLLDKGFVGIFRNKPQHHTGLSVRLSQHYGGAGIILMVLGIAAVLQGWNGSTVLLFCGCFVFFLGLVFLIYYMSFGIYYDQASFIWTSFGKKNMTYQYGQIIGQKLYRLTGGYILIELYLEEGKTISLPSTMKGLYPFLDTAFDGWCQQKGIAAETCSFHNVQNSCWFPSMEVE